MDEEVRAIDEMSNLHYWCKLCMFPCARVAWFLDFTVLTDTNVGVGG